MLSRASWLPLAEKLSLQDGRSRRVNHDCGEGRTLQLSREGPRLRAWCHRCNDGDSYVQAEALADRIARLSRGATADAEATQSDLPHDSLRPWPEWPVAARLWLVRAGLSSEDAGKLGAKFSEPMARVVLPCGDSFWQARSIDGRQPKYLAPLVPKQYPRYGNGADRITLTEDILSAYKVGKVAEGWCMLGTSIPDAIVRRILRDGRPVNVWLDNDLPPTHTVNRGQIAAAKVVKKLRAHGVSVRNIVTRADPKLITLAEIKELTA